jgi:hypothetical protein
MRNTRVQERIVREPLFVQDFLQTFRVQVFRIARPVESVAESEAESAVLVTVESAVHAITVHAICDLASHVVERLPQWNTIILCEALQVFPPLQAPTWHSVVDDMR